MYNVVVSRNEDSAPVFYDQFKERWVAEEIARFIAIQLTGKSGFVQTNKAGSVVTSPAGRTVAKVLVLG